MSDRTTNAPLPLVPPWFAWLVLLAVPAATYFAIREKMAAWAVMWTVSAAVFAGCKVLSLSAAKLERVSRTRLAAYLFLWPGLDAATFLDPSPRVPTPQTTESLRAVFNIALGVALIWGVPHASVQVGDMVRGWMGMVGLILVLHFGTFHLLSVAWRRAGVAARPLMNAPTHAATVSEFWGKRWNTAFRDLTHRTMFRPVAARTGPAVALAVVFVMSGLVHDLVISIPAGGGAGLPTAYFVLQGAALLLERRWTSSSRRHPVASRLFTWLVVAAPAPCLFHPPFIRVVILPFLEALGAAPTGVTP